MKKTMPMSHSVRQKKASRSREHQHLFKRSVASVLVTSLILAQPSLAFAQTVVQPGDNIYTYLNAGNYDLILDGDATWGNAFAVNTLARSNISIDGQGNTVYYTGNTHSFLQGFNQTNTVSLTNVNFTRDASAGNNYTALFYYNNGGSAANRRQSTLNLEGSTFEGFYNTQYKDGGIIAIHADYNDVIIDGGASGVTYRGNRGENDTAGVLNINNSYNTVTLEGLHTFEGNWSGNYAGAINVYETNSSLTANGELRFLNNHAVVYGGAVDFWGGNTTTNFNGVVTFDGNYIYHQEGNDEQSPPHVTDQHPRGGAMNMGVVGSDSTVMTVNFNDAVTFNGNYVVNSRTTGDRQNAYGGAVSVYDNGANRDYRLSFNDAAVFTNNYAYAAGGQGNGGALFYQLSRTNAQGLSLQGGTLFENNYASTYGGAIYLQTGTITLNATGDDITFQGNRHGVAFSQDPGNQYNYIADSSSGTPNAVYVNGNGGLALTAADGKTIHFYDPIATAAGANFTITKDGEGDVAFYGDGGATTDYDSNIRVNTTVTEGTFSLLDGVGYGVTDYGIFEVRDNGTLLGADDAELRVSSVLIGQGGSVGGAGGNFNLNSANIFMTDGSSFVGNGTLTAASDVYMTDTISGNILEDETLILDVDLVGVGNLAKIGEGTLVLARDTAYTGTTTVTEGILRTDVVNAIDQSSGVTVATDGILRLNNNNQIIQYLSGAGAIELGSATMALQNTANVNTEFEGVISGTGNITKEGAGDITLSGINTYSGGTRTISGNLIAKGAEALGTGVITIDTDSMLFVDQDTGTEGTLNQSITGGGQLYKRDPGSLTLTSNTSNLAGGDLVIQAGNLILDQNGQFNAGRTIMQGGTLTLNEDARLNLTDTFMQMSANTNVVINLDDDPTAFITANSAILQGDLEINNFSSTIPDRASDVQSESRVIVDSNTAINGTFNTVTFGDGAMWPDYLVRAGRISTNGLQYILESDLAWYADPAVAHGDFTVATGNAFDVDVVLANRTTTPPLNSNWDGQSLTKAGAGTLILSDQNTYTGTTTVNAGTLQFGTGNSIQTSSAVSVASGATIDLNDYNQIFNNLTGDGDITLGAGTLTARNATATDNTTFNGDISGTGGLTKTGLGTLTLTGDNTFTGLLTLDNNGGRLIATGTAAVGEGDVELGTNSTLEFNIATGNTNTFDNYIHGSGTVEKTGAGTLIWSEEIRSEESSIGNLVVSAGTLQIDEDLRMDVMMDIDIGNATLVLTPGADIQSSGTMTLSNNSTVEATLAGDKSSAVILANTSNLDGALILNGYESYTVGNASALEDSRYKVIESSTAMNGDFDTVTLVGAQSEVDYLTLTHDKREFENEWGGTSYFYTVGLDLTWNAPDPLDAHGTFTLDAGDTFNVDVALADRSDGPPFANSWDGTSLTKSGAGTLILSGGVDASDNYLANTYTGTTTINGGTLQLNGEDVIASSSAVTLNGGTLSLGADQTLNNLLSTGGTNAVNLNSFDLTANNTTSGTLAAVISGTGSFTKDGSGSLVLSGVNTYSGGTVITDGTLTANGVAALGSGGITNEAALIIDQQGDATYDEIFSGSGSFTKNNVGNLTLTGSNSEQGNVEVREGGLTFNSGDTFTAEKYTTFGGSAPTPSTTIGSTTQLVVNDVFTQSNNSILNVSANNVRPSVSADTAALGGTLNISDLSVTAPTQSSQLANQQYTIITTANGITNDFSTINFGGSSPASYLTLGGQAVSRGGNAKDYVVGLGLTWYADGAVANGTFNLVNGSDRFTVDTPLNDRNGPQDPITSGWDGVSLTKEGEGTLILSAANTYSGETIVSGGTLQLSGVNTIQDSERVTLNLGSTLSATAEQTVQNLGGSGNVNLGAVMFTVDNSENTELTGQITGAGMLIKEGIGDLTLSGTNSYISGTTINDGLLIAQGIGALSTGAISNNSALQINQSTNDASTALQFSGLGSFEKTGSSTLRLTNSNFTQGDVTVSAGGLTLDNNNVFKASSYTTNSGATTTIGNGTQLNVTNAFTQQGSSALDVTISDYTADPAITAGSASLGGKLTLSGLEIPEPVRATEVDARNYTLIETTGGITGNFDTFEFGGLSSPANYLTFGGSVVNNNDYVVGLGLRWFAGTPDGDGNFNVASGKTFDVDVALTTQTGSFTSSWDGQSLTKDGEGTLILSATNNYSGETIVNDGTLQLSATGGNTISSSSQVTVNSGGTLALTNNQTVNHLMGQGDVDLGSSRLTVNNTSMGTTLFGTITGTGSLEKTGGNTLVLRGNNDYSGGTLITDGTLEARGVQTLGSGPVENNSMLRIVQDNDASYDALLSGTGMLTKQGAGILTLTRDNSTQGNVTVQEGELAFANDITFNAGNYTTNASTTTTINTGAQLNLTNAYTQQGTNSTLNVAISDYTADPAIIAGSAALEGKLTLSGLEIPEPVRASEVDARNYTLIETTGGITGNFDTFEFGGLASPADYLTFGGSVVNNNDYVVGLGLRWNDTDVNNARGTFTVDTGKTFDVDVILADRTLTPPLNASWDGQSLTKEGAGTLILSAANTYTGNTTLNDGTLIIGANQAYQGDTVVNGGLLQFDTTDFAIDDSANVSIATGATVDLNGTIQRLNNLTGGGNITLGDGQLRAHNSTGTTFTGLISGDGYLRKEGGDTLTLIGENTYTGGTIIDNGRIIAQGASALGTGTIDNRADLMILENGEATLRQNITHTLNTGTETFDKVGGGTLTLTGSIVELGTATVHGGTLVLNNGSSVTARNYMTNIGTTTIAPTTTLAIDNLFTQQGGSTLNVDASANKTAVTADEASLMNGSLVINNLDVSTVDRASDLAAQQYTVISTTNGITGNFGNVSYGGAVSPADYLTLGTQIVNTTGNGQDLTAGLGLSWNDTDVNAAHGTFTLDAGDTFNVDVVLANRTSTPPLNSVWDGQSLTKEGAGTLRITAQQAYTGNTNLNAGTLELNVTDAIASSAQVKLGGTLSLGANNTLRELDGSGNINLNDYNLTVNNANPHLLTGTITGTGDFIKEGIGMLQLYGTNTYSGDTIINGGVLFAATLNSLGTGDVTNNAALQINHTGTRDYNALFSGNGTFTKQGSGTINLTRAGSEQGNVVVQAGGLTFNSGDIFTATNNYTMGNGATTTVGATTQLQVGNVFNHNFNSTLNVDASANKTAVTADTATLAGSLVISNLDVSGADRASELSGQQYTVISTTNGITDNLTSVNLTGASSPADYLTLGTQVVNTGGNGQDLTAGLGLTWFAGTTLGNGVFTVGSGNSFDVDVVLSDQGTSTTGWNGQDLTKNGAGTLILSEQNTYTGSTTVNAGTLIISDIQAYQGNTNVNGGLLQFDGTDNAIADSRAVSVASNATIDLNDTNQRFNNLSGTGNITLGSGTLRAINANAGVDDTTFAGVISGTGALVKDGGASLTLSGENTYTGGTTITGGGTLIAEGAAALSTGTITIENGSGLTVDGDGTLTQDILQGGGSNLFTKQGDGTLTLTGNTLQLGNVNVSFVSDPDRTNTLALNNGGTVSANNYRTYSGATTSIAANTQLNVTDSFIQSSGATLDVAITDSTDTLTPKVTANTAILRGDLVVSGLELPEPERASDVESRNYTVITTLNGITDEFDSVDFGDLTSPADYLSLGGNVVSAGGNAENYVVGLGLRWNDADVNNASGTFTVDSGKTFDVDVVLANRTSTPPLNSVWDGQSLTKEGDGTLILTGGRNSSNQVIPMSYTGSTIVNGGTLQMNATNVIRNSTAVSVAANATIDLNDYNQTFINLSGEGDILLGSAELTANNWTDTTFEGEISGTGSLVKSGTAPLTLVGDNSYTGGTTIATGTLVAQGIGAIGTGNVLNVAGFIVDQETIDGTYSGRITGGGTLYKQGDRTLTLTGTGSSQANVTVRAGELELSMPGTFTVGGLAYTTQDGATTTINSGSQLVATGTFTQDDGAMLNVNIANRDYSTPAVSAGKASLDGDLRLTGLEIPAPTLASEATGRAYTVIETTYGITGDFDTVDFGTASAPFDYLTLDGSIQGNDYVVGLGLTWYADPAVADGIFTVNTGYDFNIDVDLTNQTGPFASNWDGQSLTKEGSGTLILTGATNAQGVGSTMSYTGSTAVNGGTLQMNATDVIANSTAVSVAANATIDLNDFDQIFQNVSGEGDITLGSATLTADISSDSQFEGIISGTGSVVKEGGNEWRLTETNTYRGGTTINDGTLYAASGIAALGTGDVANDATLIINQGNDGSFAGVLSGDGSFDKTGSGTLTLTGSNSAQGDVTVASGGLTFDGTGAFSAADYTTQASATTTLTGNSQINASGVFTQATNSTLDVDISANTPKVIADSADLAGSLVVSGLTTVPPAKASDLNDDVVTIIQTQNGITGDFDSVNLGTITNPLDFIVLDSYVSNNNLDYVAGMSLAWNAQPDVAHGTFTLGANQSFDVDVTLEDKTGITSGWDGKSLTKNGEGTLILSDTNLYSGTTTINGGTLQLNQDNAIAYSSAVTVNSEGSLSLGADQTVNNLSGAGDINLGSSFLTTSTSGTLEISGVISGTGSFEKIGTGTLTLSGENTYSGETWINGGTLIAQEVSALGNTSQVLNNSALVIDQTANAEFGTTIQGTGALTKTGSGTLTLTANGSSQNTVTVAQGGLTLDVNGYFDAIDYTTASNATTTIAGNSQINATGVFTQAANSILEVDIGVNMPKVLADTASLDGALVLSGLTVDSPTKASDLTGDVVTIISTQNGITGDFRSVDLGVADNPLDFIILDSYVTANQLDYVAGMSLAWNAGADVAHGTFTLGANQSFDVDVSLDDRTDSITSGWDGQSLTKAGDGTLILSDTNGYTGTTTINGGTLQLSAVDTIADSSAVTVNAGTLALTTDQNVNNLSGAGNVDLGSSSLRANNTGNLTLSGDMSGTGSFIKDDAGTLTLSGDNTYSGGTTIDGGTLIAQDATALGAGNVANNSALIINQGNDGSFAGVLSGAGSFDKTGTGTLTLTGGNSTQGDVTVSAGGLALTSGDTFNASTYTTNSGATTTIDNGTQLVVNGAFTQDANSTLNVNIFDRNYTDAAVVSDTASLDGGLYLSGLEIPEPVLASEVNGRAYTVIETTNGITGDFASVDFGSASTSMDYLTLDGSIQGNDYVVGLGLSWYADPASAHGTFTLGSSSTFNVDLALNDRSGITSGWDGQSLTKAGDGTLILSAANGYTGTTTINGGTLQLSAVDTIANSSAVTINSGGTLSLTANQNVNNLSGAGNVDLGSSSLTANNTGDLTLSGVVSGSGSFTKDGTGTLTLSGDNTYSGGTTIDNGTLIAQDVVALGTGNVANNSALIINQGNEGSFAGILSGEGSFDKTGNGTLTLTASGSAQGDVTVAGGGLTFDGTGIFNAGSYFTQNGATTTLGDNAQLQVAGDFTQAAGSTLDVSLGMFEPNVIANTASLDGDLVVSGLASVTPSKASDLTGNQVTIISTTNGITGDFASVEFGTADNPLDFITFDAHVTDDSLNYVAGLGLSWEASEERAHGTFTLGNEQTFDVDVALNDRTGDFTSGWDGKSLTKEGEGTLILSAQNGYTGTTTVNGGTLQLSAIDAIANSSSVTLGSGSTLALTADQNVNNLSGAGNVDLGSSSLTANNTGDLTLSGVVSGSGSFTKDGTGTLTLSGDNTYSGGTTIDDGKLIANGAGALGTGDVANNAALEINQGTDASFDGVLSGSGSFDKTGSGTLTLTASGSSQGDVTVATGGLTFDGTGVFNAGSYLTQNGATTTLGDNAQLQVAGDFTQAAGSTLEVTLGAFNPNVIADTASLDGNLVVSGLTTTLPSKASDLTGNQVTIISTTNGITGDFASVDLGTDDNPMDFLTLDSHVTDDNLNYVAGLGLTWEAREDKAHGTFTLGSGEIFDVDVALNDRTGDFTSGWDGQSLTKEGDGALILSAQNGYTGTTTVNGGTLRLSAVDAIASSSAVSLNSGSTLGLTADQNVNNLSGAGNINLGSSALTAHNDVNSTLSGLIYGDGSFTKDGTGTLTLSGNNTYSGGTTIDNGKLIALGVGSLGTGNIANNAALEINQSSDASFDGVLSGNGSFDKTGNGTLTLTGSNSSQGDVIVQTGGLTLDSGDTFSANTYTTQNGATTSIGGDTQLAVSGAFTQDANATLNVAVGNGQAAVTAGNADLEGTLIVTGLDVSAPDRASDLDDRLYTVITTTSGITGDFATVDLGGGSSPADYLTLGGNVVDGTDYVVGLGLSWYAKETQAHGTFTLDANQTFNVDVALNDRDGITSGWDGTSLTKEGAGTLILSAENGYTGSTNVNGGTLSLEADKALGSTSLLDVAGNATVALNGTTQSVGRLNTDTGARVDFDGGTLTITDSQRAAGDLNGGFVEANTLFGDGLLALDPSILTVNGANDEFMGDVTVSLGSQVILNDGSGLGDVGTITLTGTDDRLTFDTVSGKTAKGTLSKDLVGLGQLQTRNEADITLAGDNSNFSGSMDVAENSTLRVSDEEHVGTASLNIDGLLAMTVNDDWNLTNTVTGAGELNKVGDATVVVQNNLSDFTGTISLDKGMLVAGDDTVADITVGASQVDVAKGTVLTGSGTIVGNVTNAGSIVSLNAISDYDTVGTTNLTVGPLTNSGLIQLAGETIGNTLTVTGGLTAEEGSTLVINTVLGNDDSATDKLILDGGDTTGTTTMVVQNKGGLGAQTDVGILVVDAINGATTVEDAFVLSSASTGYRPQTGTLVAGAYDYSLVRGSEGGDDDSWYLAVDAARPEPRGYLSNREQTQTMFRQTLYDRMMGYEVVTDTYTGEQYNHAVWARIDGNRTRTYADEGNLKTKGNTFTMRAGVDLAREVNENGSFTGGLMGAVGRGTNHTHSTNNDDLSAKGTVDGYAVGLYGTWFQKPQAKEGAYVDSWVQYSFYDNDVSGSGLPKESYNSRLLSVSLEGGYRTPLMEDERMSLAIEPQAQVIFDRYTGGNFTEDNGTRVEQDGKNSVTTRLGARLHGRTETQEGTILEPSIEANWWHSSRQNRIRLDDHTVNSDRPKDIGELRLGLTARPRKDMAITFEVNGEIGSHNYRQYGGGIGFRLDF